MSRLNRWVRERTPWVRNFFFPYAVFSVWLFFLCYLVREWMR